MKKIDRSNLANLINKRLRGSLKKRVIADAINEINKLVIDLLVRDTSISINNFGTFAPFSVNSRYGIDVIKKELVWMPAVKRVKLICHATFYSQIATRREKLLRQLRPKNS